MAGKMNSKLKTLVLADILREQTDENHPMSATDICTELKARGIDAERKSIYANLEVLEQYGLDIIKTSFPKKGCYLGARNYEAAEVRLLVDAVRSAGFISNKKTKQLVSKIEKSLSTFQREDMDRQVYMDNCTKTTNECVYYIIDGLSRAIDSGCKVRLHYVSRKIQQGNTVRHEERSFKLSPYALIWFDGHYYLVCNNQKYPDFMHIRVEHIRDVTILEDEPVRDCAEFSDYKSGFDCADYSQKIFNGYAGEPEEVTLQCANGLSQAIMDRFGDRIPIAKVGASTFDIRITAAVSTGLVNWILQFGDQMLVLSPDTLRESVYEKAKAAAKMYEQPEGQK